MGFGGEGEASQIERVSEVVGAADSNDGAGLERDGGE